MPARAFGTSLRSRLLLVLLLAAVLPLVAIGAWLVRSSSRAGEDLLRAQLGALLEAQAERLAENWREVNGDLLLLAENDIAWRMLVAQGEDRASERDYLRQVFRTMHPAVVRVHYVDAAGATRLALPLTGPAAASAGLLPAAPDSGGTFHVEVPVRDAADARVGAMHAVLRLESLLPAQQVAGPDALFAIIDARTGGVLAAPPMPADALADGAFRWSDAEWLSVSRALEEPPIELRLAAPLAPFVQPFARAARTGSIALVFVALVVIAAATFLTARITRSVADATRAAEAIAGGDLEHRVEVDSIDEVGRLGRALNSLAANLRETLDALTRQRTHAALGEFATALAHEVRNAHTAIGVDLEHVLEQSPDRPAVQAALRRSLRRVRSIDRIVNGALRVARSGRVEFRTVDLRGVLHDAVRAAHPWFSERNAALRFEAAPHDPVHVMGDAAALETLFVNLLRNSAQALDAGGHAELSLLKNGVDVTVLVHDEGTGMSAEQLATAFHPFVTARDDGTGLGLPIARQIAYAHGGDIEITSEPGAGTLVQVRLVTSQPTNTETES